MLGEAGAEVRIAVDAKDALRTLLQWPPSILVSDLAMPKTDGYMLLREVRSLHRQIPAIAVTGMGDATDREAALAAGFQAHVTKPLDPEMLVAIVRQWAVPDGDATEGASLVPPSPLP